MEGTPITMIEFGTKIAGKDYTHRLCAYAVLINEDGLIGIVENPRGCFLVGGGIDEGEEPMLALAREALEEIGMSIEILGKIGHAINHDKQYWSKEGHYFRARTIEFIQDPVELDHEFKWLTKEEALKRLFYETHRWAVEQCF